jgi:L-galactose dehydrogenase
MEYKELGKTGIATSAVSYGTAPLGGVFGAVEDEHAAISVVHKALDLGINLFDSSPYYGNGVAEERLGRALRGRRDQVIVATKAGRYGPADFDFSPARIRRSLEESLRLLGTDYVDIFQLHDIEFVPMDSVLIDSFAELERLRDEGKCRYIGMTGYPLAALRRVVVETDIDVVLCYGHATLLDGSLKISLLPEAIDHGVGLINASAVALGLLTGGPIKLKTGHPAPQSFFDAAERASAAAQRFGIDISVLANQYSIQRSGCATTLVGTTNMKHLEEIAAAATAHIDEEALAAVIAAVGDVRGQSWTSGLLENN